MSESSPKTEVWIIRYTDSLPKIEREEWRLGTDEPVFQYGDCLVYRSRAAALKRLCWELEELRAEAAIVLVRARELVESAGEEGRGR